MYIVYHNYGKINRADLEFVSYQCVEVERTRKWVLAEGNLLVLEDVGIKIEDDSSIAERLDAKSS